MPLQRKENGYDDTDTQLKENYVEYNNKLH